MKEKVMNWRVILMGVFLGSLFCCPVQASESGVESGVNLGPVAQIKVNPHAELTDSLGATGTFHLGGGAVEMHTSVWVNVIGPIGGGIGGGTIHHLNHYFLLGWEISAEYEKEEVEEVWFVGAGPVFEACATEEVHLFLKVPVGWEHTHHRDHLVWSVVAGVSIFLFH